MPMLAALAAMSLAAASPFPQERDPGGCRLERLAAVDGENHVLFRGISPDGRELAVGWDRRNADRTERGAYLLDLVTGNKRDLPGLNNAAAFAPDGKRLVAANYPDPAPGELKTEIVELDLDTGKLRSLAPDPALDWLPSYSPDGRWVVFNSLRSGASDLYRVDLRSAAVERLTQDPRYEAHAQFSNDGKRILFHREVEPDDYALAVLDVRTRRVTELPGSRREQAYPAWSPDNRWIAYGDDTLQDKGKTDLYLMRSDGTHARRLTTHPAKDAYPTFAPDGRSIVFMRAQEEGVRVYRMHIRNGRCLR